MPVADGDSGPREGRGHRALSGVWFYFPNQPFGAAALVAGDTKRPGSFGRGRGLETGDGGWDMSACPG